MSTPTPPGPLLSTDDLSIWPGIGTIPAENEDWADYCIEAASEKVRTVARQAAWSASTAPVRAKQIAWHLAARTYLNPESVSSEGAVGPLGGDTIVTDMARAMHLSDSETAELQEIGASFGSSGRSGSLWVQPINGPQVATDGTIYLHDTHAAWPIPYGHPDDAFAFTPPVT